MKKHGRENKILKVLIAVCAAAGVGLLIGIGILLSNMGKDKPQTETVSQVQADELVITETDKRTEGFVTITTYDGMTVQYFGDVNIICDGKNGKQVEIELEGFCVEYCPHINPSEMERTD